MGVSPKAGNEQQKSAEFNRQKERQEAPPQDENGKKRDEPFLSLIFDIERAESKMFWAGILFVLGYLYYMGAEEQAKQVYQDEAIERYRRRENLPIDQKPL